MRGESPGVLIAIRVCRRPDQPRGSAGRTLPQKRHEKLPMLWGASFISVAFLRIGNDMWRYQTSAIDRRSLPPAVHSSRNAVFCPRQLIK